MPDVLTLSQKMQWYSAWVQNRFFRTLPSLDEMERIDAEQLSRLVSPTAVRGVCFISFPGTEKSDICKNAKTDDECRDLAKAAGGFPHLPVTPGECST
ncbi:hypothetical protein [Tardiphaga sp. P9-11]|uniref:hypothetical protein n=1 Tax=Tardiphaga sp. P9-11 TaxID=2024614 RepID=UPI0011F0D682|nr:hypothetical protein [Tardiphaga sp. P9-11]